jgi:hypothetical protein
MKNRLHGSSLYYATDKNIFDALNQHKVDMPTIIKLFERRNIIVGKKTDRAGLASYFSRLTHDYYDHKDIAARLGVSTRRERITSMDIVGADEATEIQAALDQLKQELETSGDVVQVSRDGDNFSVNVQYSTVDYGRSEFTQVQVRDGSVEFVKSTQGYIVRNTQNDYLNDVRDTVLAKIEKATDVSLQKVAVSLFDVPSPKLRTKFFYELVNSLPGYRRCDVSEVYVFKPKPETEGDEDSSDSEDGSASHIERVFLRGSGVTRSELLNDLLEEENYYIVKIGWTATETMGAGSIYDIEAVFEDPASSNDT